MGDVGVWTSIGPASIGPQATGVLFSIALDSANPNWIYVASPNGGVWKTEDGAASWWPIADDLPSLAVAALATDPSMPGRVYMALPAQPLYRSDDGGASWSGLTPPPGPLPAVTDLFVDPTNPMVLHLRGTSQLFRSGDGGASWQVTKNIRATSLALDPTNSSVLYASDLTGVFRSIDGGLSGDTGWVNITSPGIPPFDAFVVDVSAASAPTDPDTIYVRIKQTRGDDHIASVYRSSDAGSSWRQQSVLDQTVSAYIAVDAVNPDTVYLAGVEFYRSDDAGRHWTIKGNSGANLPHVDHHGFAVDPNQPATIYTACDGGLYRSHNRGDAWDFLARGLKNVLFFDIAISAQEPNVVIGGTQDNGTALYDGSSDQWKAIWGGDGGTVAIDPTDGGVMYAMNQDAASMVRSSDHGAHFQGNANGLPHDCFNFYFQVHPKQPNVLLACCRSLWSATEPSAAWTVLFDPQDGFKVTLCAVEGRTDTYYAANNGGRLYAGPGGTDWQLVFEHPFGAAFSDLFTDPDDPSVVYASFVGDHGGRIYRLRGGAGGPLTGTDVTGDLPSGLHVQTLALDAINDFTLYAGTQAGVFAGHGENNVAWSLYSQGMPRADVRALRVHPATGVMRAGTFGRGAWEVNTSDPIGSVLETIGRITFLRAHDVGTGFGGPPNVLDAEAVVLLDTEPRRAFGFRLRRDGEEPTRREMFALLREAFVADRPVRIDYVRTAPRVGEIIRVANP